MLHFAGISEITSDLLKMSPEISVNSTTKFNPFYYNITDEKGTMWIPKNFYSNTKVLYLTLQAQVKNLLQSQLEWDVTGCQNLDGSINLRTSLGFPRGKRSDRIRLYLLLSAFLFQLDDHINLISICKNNVYRLLEIQPHFTEVKDIIE